MEFGKLLVHWTPASVGECSYVNYRSVSPSSSSRLIPVYYTSAPYRGTELNFAIIRLNFCRSPPRCSTYALASMFSRISSVMSRLSPVPVLHNRRSPGSSVGQHSNVNNIIWSLLLCFLLHFNYSLENTTYNSFVSGVIHQFRRDRFRVLVIQAFQQVTAQFERVAFETI